MTAVLPSCGTRMPCGLPWRSPRSTFPSAEASPRRNPSDYTPELSRRARGVEIWAALKSLGRKGVADLLERTCAYARQFAEGLTAAGFTVLNDVVLNQVLVTFGDAPATLRVISAIQADGTCWCGSTVWQGKTAMRISVSSWATTAEDVRRSLEAMIRVARAEISRYAGSLAARSLRSSCAQRAQHRAPDNQHHRGHRSNGESPAPGDDEKQRGH